MLVEPRRGVADRPFVGPVDVEPVRDDADPDPRIREAPERVGRAGDHGHRADHVEFGDRLLVQAVVLVGIEAPLVEVPGPFERQRLWIDAAQLGDDLAKPPGVVAHDTVEIDAQHELPCHIPDILPVLAATDPTSTASWLPVDHPPVQVGFRVIFADETAQFAGQAGNHAAVRQSEDP